MKYMINIEMSILWFLEELDANSYGEYLKKYSGISSGRSYFHCSMWIFRIIWCPYKLWYDKSKPLLRYV